MKTFNHSNWVCNCDANWTAESRLAKEIRSVDGYIVYTTDDTIQSVEQYTIVMAYTKKQYMSNNPQYDEDVKCPVCRYIRWRIE